MSLIAVLLLLLALVVVDLLFGVDEVGVEGRALPRLLRFGVFGIMFLWVMLEEHQYALGLSFGFAVLLLGLLMGASVVIASEDLKTDLIDLSKTYYWMLGFFFMVGMARRGVLTPGLLMYFTIPLVVMLSLKILILDRLSGASDIAVADYRNDGWKLALCLPLVFIIGSAWRKWMYFCLVLIVVAVLLSMKRGAILAMATSLACWLITSTENTIRAKLITVLKIMGIVAVAAVVVISRQDQFADRFDDISGGNIENFGSGRGLGYEAVWNRIQAADGLRLVVGHGYAAVPKALGEDIGLRVYAHSDLLEVFYDHGLIGMLLLAMIFAALTRFWLVMKRVDRTVATVLPCIIVIVLIKALISMAIYDPSMIYMVMALGYVHGKMTWEADCALSEEFFEVPHYELDG